MREPGSPYLPRRGAGLFALGSHVQRDAVREDRRLGVLVLPEALDAFALRDRARDLLSAPGVLAVDPPQVSYRALARLPEPLVAGLAAGQVRRMRFPGTPRAVVLFHPLQYPLARALLCAHDGAELWYADWSAQDDPVARGRLGRRLADLDTMAAMRAELRFDARPDSSGTPRERNLELWERLEALGVESGRLGSERAAVTRAWGDGPGASS